MASIQFDHVGVVVHDLEVTAQFFVDLGFDREGPIEVSGSWMDRVIGLEGARVELIIVTAPDGSGKLELTAFHEPTRAQDQAELPANAHGYRHIAYRVTNIDAVVAQARAAGYRTVGDVVDYQDSYRLAYIRGPEGLIVEVAEALPSASTSA
jgi:catechol 2,3-dioxygenase-like lactoylglutathione lyase family enzyme